MVDDGFNRLLASNGIVDTRPAAMRSRRARRTRPPDRFRDSFRGGNHESDVDSMSDESTEAPHGVSIPMGGGGGHVV